MTYNYYKILGISETATTEQIKRAYREKAKLCHPDINPSAKAHEVFTLINTAHATLTDVAKREMYDLKLNYNKFRYKTTTSTSTHRDTRAYNYTKSNHQQNTPEPNFEPTNTLFYSFFSVGTICGLAFASIPGIGYYMGYWHPILLFPLLLGGVIMRDGIKEIAAGIRQSLLK